MIFNSSPKVYLHLCVSASVHRQCVYQTGLKLCTTVSLTSATSAPTPHLSAVSNSLKLSAGQVKACQGRSFVDKNPQPGNNPLCSVKMGLKRRLCLDQDFLLIGRNKDVAKAVFRLRMAAAAAAVHDDNERRRERTC